MKSTASEPGLRVHFLKEVSKVIYFVCEFGSLLVEL